MFDLQTALADRRSQQAKELERIQQVYTQRLEEETARRQQTLAAFQARVNKVIPLEVQTALGGFQGRFTEYESFPYVEFTWHEDQFIIRGNSLLYLTLPNGGGLPLDIPVLDWLFDALNEYTDWKAAQEALWAVHTRLSQRVAEEKAAALQRAWSWPDGVSVTLYRWRWCVGANNEGMCDYESAWSASSGLDIETNCITVQGRKTVQFIQLDPKIHKPVVEHIVVQGLADVPAELQEPIELEIADIAYAPNQTTPDDTRCLREAPGEVFHVRLGKQPVAWVRWLVELAWSNS